MASEISRGSYNISGDGYSSSYSVNFTPAAKNNSLVLVDMAFNRDSIGEDCSVSSCTFGGTGMTLLGNVRVDDQGGHQYRHYLYKIFLSTPLGEQSLSVTFSNTVHFRVKIVDYYNVDPTSQHRTVASQTYTHPNDPEYCQVSPTSQVGDLVIDFINKYWNDYVPYAYSGQTTVWADYANYGCHSTKPGAATSTTMRWDVPGSYGGEWSHFGLALIPAPWVRGCINVF